MNDPQSADFILMGETEHPDSLIVALHGVTSNNECVRDALADYAVRFPKTLFLLPNGPLPMKATDPLIVDSLRENPKFAADKARSWFDFGYSQWLKLYMHMRRHSLPAACELHGLINGVRDHYNLAAKKTMLLGISQGGIVALETAERMEQEGEPPAGACLISSMCLIRPRKLKAPFDVAMITGDQDERTMKNPSRIDSFFQSHFRAVARLKHAGIRVKEIIIPGLDHRASPESLESAVTFVQDCLNPIAALKAA